jgi:mRNA-degrading endonuclease YafQ of YafQ-DinJ toxin-antitoxin module
MTRFELRRGFIRSYKKHISHNKKLRLQVAERIALFQQYPRHPLLHDHALKGERMHLRSFSASGDVRIIYYLEDDTAFFIDVGTHNQVY